MTVKGVFLNFDFVISYPTPVIDRKYFYLDWDEIDTILKDARAYMGKSSQS